MTDTEKPPMHIVTVAHTLLTHVNAPDGWVFMGHEGSFPLEIRDAKTFTEIVTLKDDINDMGETIAQMPSVIAQLVDALESQRAAVRLEWAQGSELIYQLVLHVYGIQKNLMLVLAMPEDDGWAYMFGSGLIGPVSKDHVILKAKEYVQSVNLPCEVPEFPGVVDV